MKKSRWFSPLLLATLFVAVCSLSLGNAARADSWTLPEVDTTLSANGQFRFTITPADIGSQLDYYRDELAAEKSGKPVERPAPIGLLEKRDARGKWEPVWAGALVNRVAPVTTLVADDGRHVVTFDNWGSTGHGEHVIVIYGPEGKLVRSLALTDFLPQEFVDALPHSVSSIQWRERESFTADASGVAVAMPVPNVEWGAENTETLTVTIALADGAATLPPADQWQAGLAAAAQVNAAMQQAEAERIAFFTNPLNPPQGCDERGWHDYLSEAFARLGGDASPYASTWTTVLFARDHPRHKESVGWLKEEMLEDWDDNNVSVASPCDPDGLVEAVNGIVKKVRPGKLANLTLYVAAPQPQYAAIARLLAPTGARTVWLDPAVAIPQRPDRIPGSPEQQAAVDAEIDSRLAEMPGN